MFVILGRAGSSDEDDPGLGLLVITLLVALPGNSGSVDLVNITCEFQHLISDKHQIICYRQSSTVVQGTAHY